MRKAIPTTLIAAFAVGWAACHSMGPGFTVDPDAGADADSDSDNDADSDSDTDTSIADSDGDWLSDQWEEAHGTDPDDPDSDGDGASDLVEHLAGTDPLDGEDNPWNNSGQLYFVMPYEGDPQPGDDRQIFATDINKADFFVLADTTGTMVQPINQLKTDLTGTIVPAIAELVPDMWYGLGRFDDYPLSPYGFPPDAVYELRLRTTENTETFNAAINALNTHSGGDLPESQVPALWATATGEGLGTYLGPQTECAESEIGYPCFRRGALPIILFITDAVFHNGYDDSNPYTLVTPDPPDYAAAMAELNAIHAKLITTWVDTTSNAEAGEHCEQLAWDTGSVTAEDEPVSLSVTWPSYDFATAVVDGFDMLINEVPLTSIAPAARDGNPDDEIDATVFVRDLEPDTGGGLADPKDPTEICAGGLPVQDIDDDDPPDVFGEVVPGPRVCFHVIPEPNTSVPEGDDPMVYGVLIDAVGSEVTTLDTRLVFFVVPPAEPIT